MSEPVINPNVHFGKADETWNQYGIQMHPLSFAKDGVNFNDTKFRAITYNGEFVNVVTKSYVMLPNEEALKAAKAPADMVGLVPFKGFDTFGLQKVGNAMFNQNRTTMHAWFINKEFDPRSDGTGHNIVKIKNDDVGIGIDVKNSIDGTSAFGVGLFTYRGICSNGSIFGQQKIAGGFSQAHGQGLEAQIKQLKSLMVQMMEKAQMVRESYQRFSQLPVTLDVLERLRNSRIPKALLPAYIPKDKKDPIQVPNIDQWNLYNQLTESIWHNGKTDLKSRETQFNALHEIMPVLTVR